MYSLRAILAALTGLGAVAGCGYYLLCLWSAADFLRTIRRQNPAPFTPGVPAEPAFGSLGWTPPVSILKPLKGTDPGMYEAFRSHCVQDYPEYEFIFGVSDPQDPAVELVRRLQHEFPHRTIELVVCPKVLGTNRKVSSLVQMLPRARYDHLIVNDSDINVEPDYLRRVLAPFADERVGMVTCLYRGIAGHTLGSKLESVGISTDFSGGVLVARVLEGIHFALGSTLAFPRRALDAIGGFEPLLDYLADDFELGSRISKAGFEVRLSDVVVDHHLPDYSIRSFFQHQLRWARSVRDARRWGYTGVVLTFGLPWALVAVVLSRGQGWSWAMLAIALLLRILVALVVGARVLNDRQVLRYLYLLPLRDFAGLLLWAASYAGHTVSWRGDLFVLKDGKMRPV